MTKRILTALLILAMIPAMVLAAEWALPEYYGDAYYAELADMYHRLQNAEGKKIVIIGGSNVAFGVDTALLEDTLADMGYEYTVCSFGLYAAVGTEVMLELSVNTLNEDDIVVLAMEPTSETMSGYFGATAFWKCLESAPEMILSVSESQFNALAGNYIPYLQERLEIQASGTLPAVQGVYAKASFDQRCDMIYDRAGNDMALGFDPASPIDLSSVTISQDFADRVNEYCRSAERKGAQVYLSFSPMNGLSMTDKSEEALYNYFKLCGETFLCPVISDPADYVLNSGYFYDSNFHLNNAGAVIRTMRLAEDLLNQFGCTIPLEYEIPSIPHSIYQPPAETEGDVQAFTFESYFGIGWLISGLTEDGQARTSLTVPFNHEGLPVIGFTEDALANGQNLKELILTENIESLPDYLFTNCPSLTRLVLPHTKTACTIFEHTFDGVDQIRVYIPPESYSLYRDGAGCENNLWADHMDKIVAE